jgi:hypothetical protein
MSMKPQPIPEIPAETVRVVRAVFPKGNIYIHLRDCTGYLVHLFRKNHRQNERAYLH